MKTWFEPIQLLNTEESHKGTVFKLGVPTDFHKNWISENFLDRICQEISSITQGPFEIKLIVDPNLEVPEPTASSNEAVAVENFINLAPQQEPDFANYHRFNKTVLNPELTFSTFVVGRNNEFAHAACFNVSKNPGKGYNPLFIFGPTGMGKTHLLNAVGNFIMENFPQLKIRYVSTESYLNEFISSIRRNEMHKFKKKYREDCDVLLLDDIHVLGNKDQLQEEIFHTFNYYFETGRQIIVASDRMPRDIAGLQDRIRTRLEGGLITDIQMPDAETRMAILRYKAERLNIMVSDEVVNYIARISKRSIRELEGNLKKVKMYTELKGVPITVDLTKQILASHSSESQQLTVEDIQKLVAEHFDIKIVDLKSSNRAKPIVIARQVAMYLIKTYLEKSLVDIGRAFGGRDHTTVISALRRVEELQKENSDLRKDIEDLHRKIHNITGV